MSAADLTIVFDGGSLGNPGKGYGTYRVRPAGGEWSDPVRLDFGTRVTNNEAEYRTLIAALEAVADDVEDPAATKIEVRGDSRLVINQIKGEWRVKARNLQPLRRAARTQVDRFLEVRLVWQRRDASVELLGH